MIQHFLITSAMNEYRNNAIDVAVVLVVRPLWIVHQPKWIPDFDIYIANCIAQLLNLVSIEGTSNFH